MDYTKLENNLIDVILEAQLKIGYEGRSMSMNYPLGSLNRLLGTSADGTEMCRILAGFSDFTQDKLGRVEFTQHDGDIFRLCVPEKGVQYIHGLSGNAASGFLADFIGIIKQPGTTIDGALEVFRKYSDKVHVEKSNNDEFDYLVYFEDGNPDDHYYCLTDEGICVTYHRFTKEDYEDLGF